MEQVTPVVGYSMDDVNTAIASLKRGQLSTVAQIGRVLVMACYASIVGIPESDKPEAARDHVGVANALLANLNRSQKRSAIVCFLEHYGALYQGKKGMEHFSISKLEWTAEYVKAVKVASLTWEALKDDPEDKGLDVEASVRSIITKAAKRQKEGKPVANEPLLANLVAALAAFTSAQADAALRGEPVES